MPTDSVNSGDAGGLHIPDAPSSPDDGARCVRAAGDAAGAAATASAGATDVDDVADGEVAP